MAKNSTPLIIVIILSVIFFALVLLSYGDTNVDINYDFKDSITLTDYPDYNDKISIGEIKIQNNGFMPKKIRLKNYVLCQISDYFGDQTYNLEYSGSQREYDINMIFDGRYRNYIEISGNDEITLDIKPNIYSYSLKNSVDEYDLSNRTLPFYIFEISEEDSRYYYNYCDNQNIEDAFKVIYVTLDIENYVEDKEVTSLKWN